MKSFFLSLALAFSLSGCSFIGGRLAEFRNSMPNVMQAYDASHPVAVATGNKDTSKTALEILELGGTAADAFAAAMMTLTLVEPGAAGIGGGFFALYYDAKKKKVYSIDAREESPRKIDPKSFLNEKGEPLRFFPERQSSALAVGVPGTADGLALLLKNFGKLSLEENFAPAMKIANEGFIVSEHLAHLLLYDAELSCERTGTPRIAAYPSSRALFMKPLDDTKKPTLKCDGKNLYPWQPLQAGDILINSDFAKTLEILRTDGLSSFYNGQIARTIVDLLNRENPGKTDSIVPPAYKIKPSTIDMDDMRNYRAVFRKPIKFKFRDKEKKMLEAYSMGPPSSGGIALAEIFAALDNPETDKAEFDLNYFGKYRVGDKKSYRGVFLKSELSKIAFLDRNLYLADEDFISDLKKIKRELVSPSYGTKLRSSYLSYGQRDLADMTIEPETFSDSALKPSPIDFEPQSKCLASTENIEHGTTHISISDKYGNVISATASVEWFFGNGMVLPGYGFVLNNQLTDFESEPSKCNGIEAGRRKRSSARGTMSDSKKAKDSFGTKRPRSSMSPTIVLKDKKPVLAIGAAGGSTIIGSVAQVLFNVFHHGLSLKNAIDAPRFYNRNQGELLLEREMFSDRELLEFLLETGTAKALKLRKLEDDDNISSTNEKLKTKNEMKLLQKIFTSVQGIMLDKETAYAYADKRREGSAEVIN